MRTLITLVVVLFCLQLWAQVPDTTSVAPVGMNQVWARQLAYGDSVKVAVLDSGIDLGISPYGIHPDLENNLWGDLMSSGYHPAIPSLSSYVMT